MNAKNASTDHARRLIREYVELEEAVAALDEHDARLRSQLEANDAKARGLIERQERIADVLAPALRKSGPIFHLADDGRRYAIDDDPDETTLSVVKLAPAHSLELAPRFTADEIRDAAFRAAARFTADEIRDAAFRAAADFVMGEGPLDDEGDRPAAYDAVVKRQSARNRTVNPPGRQAVIANGVAVLDEEAG